MNQQGLDKLFLEKDCVQGTIVIHLGTLKIVLRNMGDNLAKDNSHESFKKEWDTGLREFSEWAVILISEQRISTAGEPT